MEPLRPTGPTGRPSLGSSAPAGPRPPRLAAPAAASLPGFFELDVPRAWRLIDFVSDLHLCATLPRTVQAFADHLRHTPADAVFVLGDLFEVWVGDDMRHRPFESACVDLLAEACSHRHVAFMVGNRDFLAGGELLRATGMLGLPDPTVLVAWGQRVMLSHGDELCLDDVPYQTFRREVRSAAWQAAFLDKPLAQRLQLAAEMRRASEQRRRQASTATADVDVAMAVRWMHAMGTPEMVHGHTHLPGSNTLAPGFKRHVLSDWDLDHGQRAEVLRLSRDGFERVPPARAS